MRDKSCRLMPAALIIQKLILLIFLTVEIIRDYYSDIAIT